MRMAPRFQHALYLQIARGSTALLWKATPVTFLWAVGDTKPID